MGGESKTNFYSKKTGLLLRSEVKKRAFTLTTSYGGYTKVDGLTLPTQVTVTSLGVNMVYTYTEIRTNTDIPLALFELPKEVKVLI